MLDGQMLEKFQSIMEEQWLYKEIGTNSPIKLVIDQNLLSNNALIILLAIALIQKIFMSNAHDHI